MSWDIDEYAEWAQANWFSGDPKALTERDLTVMSLGLGGETGEVLEKIKKHVRDGHLDKQALTLELGDVLCYLVNICGYYGLKPSEVIEANIAKLNARRQRGTLRGSGDDR